MTTARPDAIHGYVAEGFEGVPKAFTENFSRRKELGAACCVYCQGEKVVDLWGGVRNKTTGEPWEEDTMVLVCRQVQITQHALNAGLRSLSIVGLCGRHAGEAGSL